MKKIGVAVVMLLLAICLCACEEYTVTNSSDYISGDENIITQYKGKDDYENVSLGPTNFVVDEKYYYYVNWEEGFYRVDKVNGDKKLMLEGWSLQMLHYDKFIYFDNGNDAEVTVFDTETQKIETKSYKNIVFPFDIDVARTSAFMVKDGWIITVNNRQTSEVLATYFSDREFETKKQLSISQDISFALGNELFYLYNDQPTCYNVDNDRSFYLWELESEAYEESSLYAGHTFQYLGKGKILVLKDNKVNIVSLADMEVGHEFSNISSGELDAPSTVYDNEYMYFMLWENEESFRIEKISHKGDKSQKIYEETLKLPLNYCELTAVDEEYLYLFYSGYYNDDDSPSDCYYRMKKDGTGLERII